MLSLLKTIWTVFITMFRKRVTILYPEEKPYIPPRWRGRIILSADLTMRALATFPMAP